MVDALLDQIADPIASLTADGIYDQDRVYQAVTAHRPGATVIVPPHVTALVSDSVETAPPQDDPHPRMTAEHGRAAWQKASGYNLNRMLAFGRPNDVGNVQIMDWACGNCAPALSGPPSVQHSRSASGSAVSREPAKSLFYAKGGPMRPVRWCGHAGGWSSV